MSLSSAPTFTPGSTGNLYAATSLAAGASHTTTFFVGTSGQSGAQGTITTGSALSGSVQVLNSPGGTVAATAGVQVQIFRSTDGTNYGPTPYTSTTIPSVASTTASADFDLGPGQYKLIATNLDVTNAVTITETMGTTA